MFNGKKNTRENRDAGVKKKASYEPVVEKEARAHGREQRLDIEDYIHHRRIANLEREGKKNSADRRASEPGEKEATPGADIDLGDLANLPNEYGKKHEEDEDVLPKDNHLRGEEIVKGNAPGAFSPPEPRAERDEPGAITNSARGTDLQVRRV